ncbi:MAG: hypothetical protein KKD18_04330 [Nanoarchaeota archaeon]|nr:hypothetical protein [Nanoarchaeota archaeon]MBU0977618.1 hypothetical protein [Nanoarchaeota archaeon]
MTTTIKLMKETKKRLDSLSIAEKGRTYDMIINDLITYYNKSKKDYAKNLKKWEESMKVHERQVKEQDKRTKIYNESMKKYHGEREMWKRLFKWAKSKGFKG